MTTQTTTPKRDPHTLAHLARPWSERPCRIAAAHVWQRARLSELLSYAAVQANAQGYRGTTEIVIGGGATEDDRPQLDWWLEPAREGWHVAGVLGDRRSGGTYRDTATNSAARFAVRMSAPWFGSESRSSVITLARTRLRDALQDAWHDRGVHLQGTPGRTGLDLLARSLPEGHEYAPLDQDARDALWAGYGQGRMQFLSPDGQGRIAPDGLWVYDLSWAYAACTRRVPVAPFTHDAGLCLDFLPYRPGFYLVDWTVPRGWQQIGLLPLPITVSGEARTGWPSTPGAGGQSWVSGAELRLALAAGWRVAIRERVLGVDPDSIGKAGDPLRLWTDRLVHLRAKATDRGDDLLRGALRNILNQGIGHFWRRDTEELHRIPSREDWELPAGAYAPVYLPSLRRPEQIEYRTRRPLARELLPFQRPEWAAGVWGTSRALIASLALSVPRSQIAAIRTDALVLTARHPGWESLGAGAAVAQVGHMRLKRHIPGPCAIPRDEESWRELMGDAVSDEEGASADEGADDGE